MSNYKIKTLKRCIELCELQLKNAKAEIDALTTEPEDSDAEKIDAILRATGHVERSCQNIREYVRECDEY